MPNTGDMKGSRTYIRGTVNGVRRMLTAAGVQYKKIRHSGFDGVVEVITTQTHDTTPFYYLYLSGQLNRLYSPRLS